MITTIKFQQPYLDMVRSGEKTATTRLAVALSAGDLFTPIAPDGSGENGPVYTVVSVTRATAHELCMRHYRAEGFRSPFAMFEALENIYPDIMPGTPMCTVVFSEAVK